MNEPVDVFDAIHRENIWLMFQPMDKLFGIYCRVKGAAGIVVNVKVQPSMQRFTAAHELGHHVFGHEPNVDHEMEIQRFANQGTQELEAQFFAAEFLMPIAAVSKVVAEMGVDRTSLTPQDAYQISLRLGTSYLAMVNRLQTLEWISLGRANDFRDARPQDIKRSIGDEVLVASRSDVWLITRQSSNICAQVGDYVRLVLPETPSSGYRWKFNAPTSLELQSDKFCLTDNRAAIGGRGLRVFGITAQDSQRGHIKCVLERLWVPGSSIDEFELPVEFRFGTATGIYDRQSASLSAA